MLKVHCSRKIIIFLNIRFQFCLLIELCPAKLKYFIAITKFLLIVDCILALTLKFVFEWLFLSILSDLLDKGIQCVIPEFYAVCVSFNNVQRITYADIYVSVTQLSVKNWRLF